MISYAVESDYSGAALEFSDGHLRIKPMLKGISSIPKV